MGKLMLNGVDYSAPSFSGVSGVKGDKETTYRQGQVNITPANLGAATETSVNNIINGTTQVGDSEKLGGETAEQWNQKIADAKPEEIDGILDGTIPVGDSAKLGGIEASGYVTKGELLTTSILEKALTLSQGFHNFIFGGSAYTGGDLAANNYAYGSASVIKRATNAILVILWAEVNTAIASNWYNGIEWSGWKTYLTDKGGTISGQLKIDRRGSGAYFQINKNESTEADYGTYIVDCDSKGNKVQLILGASDSVIAGNQYAMRLITADGKPNTILHTGNKPKGSYTGNGQGAVRTINVGGIGNTLSITSENSAVLVFRRGAICIPRDGSAISLIPQMNISFWEGTLSLGTTNVYVNENGIAYDYEVL